MMLGHMRRRMEQPAHSYFIVVWEFPLTSKAVPLARATNPLPLDRHIPSPESQWEQVREGGGEPFENRLSRNFLTQNLSAVAGPVVVPSLAL